MNQHRRRQRATEKEVQPSVSSEPFDVYFSQSAETVYLNLNQKMMEAEARGDSTSSHCTVFRMIQEAIKVTIPRDPVNKRYGLSGPLSRFFRIKKGRYRICWAASSEKRRVCILFISETLRKQGDENDPYSIFTKLVMSGKYDAILKELGLSSPRSTGSPPTAPSIN